MADSRSTASRAAGAGGGANVAGRGNYQITLPGGITGYARANTTGGWNFGARKGRTVEQSAVKTRGEAVTRVGEAAAILRRRLRGRGA